MGKVGNFDDIIGFFSDKYIAYVVSDIEISSNGGRKYKYDKKTIYGSLQTNGRKRTFNQDSSNTLEHTYTLYCNSKYILNEEDYVIDKNGNALIITGLDPWEDEGDYRKYDLTRTKYTEKRLLSLFKGDIEDETFIETLSKFEPDEEIKLH